ncbi:MAG: histidine kinase [Geobacteraceae bacterium]|nr:histidine kinase [Geobacteraceae bacterium]
MSLKKTVTILAAAGALAAISVPAMALENEFHGSYAFSTTFSNFQAGTAGNFSPANRAEKLKMNNYFEQRARLQYIAKASDDLKLVTHFEFDNRFGAGRSATAGDLDTDFTNFELKHMYLDFNLGKNFNSKVGLQAYNDTIKGLFISADLPAIMTTTKMGAYTLGVGFSRFDDDAAASLDGSTRLGDKNKDLFIMDNTFAFSKDTKVALSYYFLADYAAGNTGGVASAQNGLDLANADNAILLHTFGLSGESKVGPLTLSGFVAAQAGHQKNGAAVGSSKQFHGYAANVAAKAAVGPGTARAAFLFTSGNNSNSASHYKGWVTSSVNTYNEGNMQIMVRDQNNSPSTTDTYLRRNVTNIALLSMGYDANLTDKIFANGNVGFGWTPASGEVAKNSSDFMGTELNLAAGYKVSPNLTLKTTAAYMILGGLYDKADVTGTKDPENPYSMRLHAQFKF